MLEIVTGSAPTGKPPEGRPQAATGKARGVFSDHRFWFWALLLVAGFAYVAGVLCHRGIPFASRRGGYAEITKLLLAAPFLYFLGPRHNMKLSWGHALGYVLLFFLALHWFYLQRISVINYSLTWNDLSHMRPIGQMVFLGGGALILGLVAYHINLAQKAKILASYILALLGSLAVIAGITWVFRDRYYLHIHHYFLFGFFIPFTRFKNPVSLACQALCAGVYVEGVSEWSMATLWYLRHG